jgi:Mg2+/Co2+ transporter CorC
LDQLGFIPKGGESFEHGSFRFTVVEMDQKRVARVKIQRLRPALKEEKPGESGSGVAPSVKESKAAAADS